MQVITASTTVPHTTANPPAFRDEIAGHHRRLRQLLAALQEVIDARAQEREGPMLATAMLALLVDLEHELPIHFEVEEQGGYFADVLRVAPEMSRHLDRLKEDHVDFMERSGQLLEYAREAAEGTRRWGEVEQLFAKLASRLSTHERNENDIIQQLFMLDSGQPG